MRKKIHMNSLFVKTISTVIIGMTSLAIILSTINITMSKQVFVETFSESQKKIFDRIDWEFYTFYKDIINVVSRSSASTAIREYLLDSSQTDEEEISYILDMKRNLGDTSLADYSNLNVLFVGLNGKTYLHNNGDKLAVSVDEILASDVVKSALENSNNLICEYMERGFTDVMKQKPVIVFAKALKNMANGEISGVILITIKEKDINDMYSYFTSATSDILLFNQDNDVISTNNPVFYEGKEKERARNILADLQEGKITNSATRLSENGEYYLLQQLQGTNYQLLGIIDPGAAFVEQYNIVNIITLILLVTGIIVLAIFLFIRQQTRPLSNLADTMGNVRAGNLEEYVKVEGTQEIRELSETYNGMIKEIKEYIEKSIKAQDEKRLAEIHALQMQINPHYMYNTLASIKWLIWQGDTKKSIDVIDAFISLLRNTISNTKEFITVEQEIENLKNYVLINHARYGEAIEVEFFVMPNCKNYAIPKLILQPFVENAFFHAFPEGMSGKIQIFVKEDEEHLRFEITDNGVGMTTEQLMSVQNREKAKDIHFTGIGIVNVDDRIKLIYGMDYGINIISEKEQGTTVTIVVSK